MTGDMGKLGEVFYRSLHNIEYELFRGQVASHPFLASLPAPPPTAPLELLPSLIKHRICAFLATIDLDGLLCIIMAVPHMAADGQVALHSAMMWAGKRIINLGGHARSLPQNLVTKDEERLWLDGEGENEDNDNKYNDDEDNDDDDDDGDDEDDDDKGTWILDTRKFVDPTSNKRNNLFARAMDYIRASQNSTRPLPSDLAKELLAPRITRPDNAVLRNLTLKQYYSDRGCYIRDLCDYDTEDSDNSYNSDNSDNIDFDYTDDLGFDLGQVVFIMTCWADGPSASYHGYWTRRDVYGEWAGHRLDIVAAEAVSPDWEDVTVAVMKKMRRLRGRVN
ncbi:hypothetical protein H4R19_003707 [Coemansia spiralis]|nr:hypothetical protein H4R19_003707 [Coemansia spiralis]